MAAQLEFDWVLIDLEHGACTEASLQAMLLAIEGTACAPIVRVVSNDQDSIKRALDLGATGVMIPYISTAEEANRAVAFTRYPPHGCRGVAGSTIATEFGLSTDEYHANIHERTMVIVQIETAEGVNNIEEIVAVDGVDVAFVGPLDLSYNLGCPKNFEHPDFIAALQKVLNACQSAGTAVGILSNEDNAKQRLEQGYTFLAVGSDAGAAKDGLQRLRDA